MNCGTAKSLDTEPNSLALFVLALLGTMGGRRRGVPGDTACLAEVQLSPCFLSN
jgi:hypothetical protein